MFSGYVCFCLWFRFINKQFCLYNDLPIWVLLSPACGCDDMPIVLISQSTFSSTMCSSCCCPFWQYGRVALLCSRLKFRWVSCLSSNESWFIQWLYIIIIIIIFYLPCLHSIKNLFTAVIARGRGEPRSHRAYGRETLITLRNKVKKKCCECAARPIQLLFLKVKTLAFLS